MSPKTETKKLHIYTYTYIAVEVVVVVVVVVTVIPWRTRAHSDYLACLLAWSAAAAAAEAARGRQAGSQFGWPVKLRAIRFNESIHMPSPVQAQPGQCSSLWSGQAARQRANWLYQLPKWILQSNWHYASWPQVISYEWKAKLPLPLSSFVSLSLLTLQAVPYLWHCLCIWAALGSDSLTFYVFPFWSRTAPVCSALYCFVLAWTSRLSFNKHSFTLSSAVAAGEVSRPHNPRQLQLFMQFSSPCASLESESVMILVWLPKVAATLPLFLSYFRSLSVFCFTLAAAFHTHEFLSGILQFSAFSFQSLTQSSGPESFDVALLLIFSKSK